MSGEGVETPPEEADLELAPGGTRFARAQTETAYQGFQYARSRDARRAWTGAVVVLMSAMTLAMLVLWPGRIGTWLPVIAIWWLAVVGLVVSAKLERPGLSVAAVLGTNAVAGVVGVYVFDVLLHAHDAGLAVVFLAMFFQRTNSLPRPWYVVVPTAPYIAVELGLLLSSGRPVSDVLFTGFMISAGLALAVTAAITSHQESRRGYRQERIIEAQKRTLGAERARSEALLQLELSHQVAERSRELGAVLAKSDVTLDVRRLSPGERFASRYRIERALGAGGMGAVYEVERVTDGQRLALKAIVGEVSGASAARFAREAEIGARVRHPSLVSIVDVGVAEGVPFLVMDLVDGGSLEAQRGRFGDVSWALPILRQIAEGLAALHDAGVVHRDLKPANVLLASVQGRTIARISDFGISRFRALDGMEVDPGAATVAPSPRPSALTGTGMVMGTPLYMAPEGARGGRAVEAPADVFALGILAYEMLTGRPPFPVPAVLLAIAEQPISPPPIDDPRVAVPLRQLIELSLAPDPASRPRLRRWVEALS